MATWVGGKFSPDRFNPNKFNTGVMIDITAPGDGGQEAGLLGYLSDIMSIHLQL
jgi:hypothetical protein